MIDVNKAREWWARFGAEVSGSQAQEIAGEYLDEIERLQKERAAAFLMSRCQCSESETCANLVRLHTRVNELELAKEVEQPRAKRGHGSPSDPASAFVDADGDRWHFAETPDGWAAVRISTRSKFAAAVSTGGRGPAAGALRAYLDARGIEWRKDGGA